MIRVLHVVSSVRVGSGVTSLLMNYYRRMDRKRVQFDFLYFKTAEESLTEEIMQLGGRVFSVKAPSLRRLFSAETETFFAAHAGEWNIVHCHPIFASAYIAAAAERHGVKNVVQHSHTARYSTHLSGRVRNAALLAFAARYITGCTACSQEAERLFFWKRPEDVFLLHNAVDFSRFHFSPEARRRTRDLLGLRDSDLLIGHVGRFSVEKNQQFLLKILHELRLLGCHAQLLLVGDGELRAQVERLATSMHLSDAVFFAGDRPDVEAYYAAMDVFVFPSLQEGFGLAAVEAQACGLTCVLSDAVPRDAIITARVERLPVESAAQWAEAVSVLAKAGRQMVSREALERSGLSIETQVDRLMTYYEGMA